VKKLEKVLIHKTQLFFLSNQRIEQVRRDNFLRNTGFCVLFWFGIHQHLVRGGIWVG